MICGLIFPTACSSFRVTVKLTAPESAFLSFDSENNFITIRQQQLKQLCHNGPKEGHSRQGKTESIRKAISLTLSLRINFERYVKQLLCSCGVVDPSSDRNSFFNS